MILLFFVDDQNKVYKPIKNRLFSLEHNLLIFLKKIKIYLDNLKTLFTNNSLLLIITREIKIIIPLYLPFLF